MDTLSIRNMILTTPLQEEPAQVPAWKDPATGQPANLLIRELNGKAGSDLLSSVTDDAGNVDQNALVANIVLGTLRNADDPKKALVFCLDPENDPDSPNLAFRDSLMATGLGSIMQVAQASIKLSGLDAATAKDAAKNGSGATPGAPSPTA